MTTARNTHGRKYKTSERQGKFARGIEYAREHSTIRRINDHFARGHYGARKRNWKLRKRRIPYNLAKDEFNLLYNGVERYEIVDTTTGRIVDRFTMLDTSGLTEGFYGEYQNFPDQRPVRQIDRKALESAQQTIEDIKREVWADLGNRPNSDLETLTAEQTAKLITSIRALRSKSYIPTVPIDCPVCDGLKSARVQPGEMTLLRSGW